MALFLRNLFMSWTPFTSSATSTPLEDTNAEKSCNAKVEECRMLWAKYEGIHPDKTLSQIAAAANLIPDSVEFALMMDQVDPLKDFRLEFDVPKMKNLPKCDMNLVNPEDDCIYLCTHSLGLKPKLADKYIQEQLKNWGQWGSHTYVEGSLPVITCDEACEEGLEKLVGASVGEVAVLNGLSVNINLLLLSFYRPTQARFRILFEDGAFPSDRYVLQSQVKLHDHTVQEALIKVSPRQGEFLLTTEDIIEAIKTYGESISVVFLGGMNFRTGQFLDIARITEAARTRGCLVGWDLAHAVGNVPLQLHSWGVDFACWCSNKYLCGGAGGMGGIFVHNRHQDSTPLLVGWWSNKLETRFNMAETIDVSKGARAFRMTTPSPWHSSLLYASLQIFSRTSMNEISRKQRFLSGYLDLLLRLHFDPEQMQVVTPQEPSQRGSLLTLNFTKMDVRQVYQLLESRGIVCDVRPPGFLRVSPSPLYCNFEDIRRFVHILKEVCMLCGRCRSTE